MTMESQKYLYPTPSFPQVEVPMLNPRRKANVSCPPCVGPWLLGSYGGRTTQRSYDVGTPIRAPGGLTKPPSGWWFDVLWSIFPHFCWEQSS